MSTNKNCFPRSQTPTLTSGWKPQQQLVKQQFQNFTNPNTQKQPIMKLNYFPPKISFQNTLQNIQPKIAQIQQKQGNQQQNQSQKKQPIKPNYSIQFNLQNDKQTQLADQIPQNQSQMNQEKQQENYLLRTSAIKPEEKQQDNQLIRAKSKSEYVQQNLQNDKQFTSNLNNLRNTIQFQSETGKKNHQNNVQQQNYALNPNKQFEQQNLQIQNNFSYQQNSQQLSQNNQIIVPLREQGKIRIISRGESAGVVNEGNQHKDAINFQQNLHNVNEKNDRQDKMNNDIQNEKEQVLETDDVMRTLTRLKTIKFKCKNCNNDIGEKLISLSCNHYFCQDCFKEYIYSLINSKNTYIVCHCQTKIKFTPLLDAEIFQLNADQFFNNQLKQIKKNCKINFQECQNCSYFWIQESLFETNFRKFCIQQEKAAKYFCPEHQKPLQFIHMRESPKQKLLCKKCESTHKLKLNKASELLLEINQDHPLNYYLKETKKQYENLRKELKHKVDELLDETEDAINNLINHKLSDRLIQRYIFDEKLNEADFEKLHEIICKYYEYEKEGQQVIAKIPANEMGNVYQIQQKCQKIESIIKAFNKPKYYQKLNTQQSQENLGSMPIIIEPNNKKQDIKKQESKKKDENKKKGLFSYNTEIVLNSVCHCIQLNKTQNILICGLQENENEENLIVLQKQNEKYQQIQNLVGHIGAVHAIQLDADGDHLFSAGEDKTIRVWKQNVLSKQLNEKQFNSIQIIQNAHQSEIHCLTLNKENNLLASGCKDGLIKIWVEIEKEWINSQTLQQHQNWVKSLSFNLETSLLASGSGDKTIIIWQLNDEWELFQIIRDHTNFVNCVCFGSINNTFVSGSEDQTIMIWEQQKDKTYICIQQLEGGHYVRSVCFNFNQLLLITGSYSTIKVWTKNHSGKFVLNQEKFYDSRQVMISEDGKSIFSVNRFSFNIRVFKIKEKVLQK